MSGLVGGEHRGPTRTDPICGYLLAHSWASQAQTSSFLRPCQMQQQLSGPIHASLWPLRSCLPGFLISPGTTLTTHVLRWTPSSSGHLWVCLCHLLLEKILGIVLSHCGRSVTTGWTRSQYLHLSTLSWRKTLYHAVAGRNVSMKEWFSLAPSRCSQWGDQGHRKKQSDLVMAPPGWAL